MKDIKNIENNFENNLENNLVNDFENDLDENLEKNLDKNLEKNQVELKGVRIHVLSVWIAFVGVALILLFLLATYQTRKAYHTLTSAMERFAQSELAADELKQASDNLTIQARLFIVSGEPIYITRYYQELETRRRENALRVLEVYLKGTKAHTSLHMALEASNDLVKVETYAMKLLTEARGLKIRGVSAYLDAVTLSPADAAADSEEKTRRAIAMTHDLGYQNYDEQIDRYIEDCVKNLDQERREAREANYRRLNVLLRAQLILAFLLLGLSAVLIFTISVLIVRPIRSIVASITEFQPLQVTRGAYELRYLARAYNRMYAENQRNSAHLRHKAEHDPLTGLYNRGAFDKIREEFRDHPIALMLIDVDLFKEVNDTWGHETGDQVLKKVASLLDRNFRFTDYPCRIGGDEFAVIMTDARSDMKDLVRRKLRHISEGLRNTSDGLPAVTLSIGAAFSDRQNGTDDIFKDADRALYAVKTHGRDACEFYGESYMKFDAF